MGVSRFLTAIVFIGIFSGSAFAQNAQTAQAAQPALEIPGIPRFVQVNKNIARGGRPTEGAIQALRQNGFRTIINLEDSLSNVGQEKKMADKQGLIFLSYPTDSFSTPNDQAVNEILAHLGNPQDYPIFIHCKHGEDRAGLMIGLHRVLSEHWTPQAAYQEMLGLGFHPILVPLKNYFQKRTGYKN